MANPSSGPHRPPPRDSAGLNPWNPGWFREPQPPRITDFWLAELTWVVEHYRNHRRLLAAFCIEPLSGQADFVALRQRRAGNQQIQSPLMSTTPAALPGQQSKPDQGPGASESGLTDTSFVGREYPPTSPYLVGREKIREFASAVGSHNPSHHDLQAAQALGYADLVAPPTFAVIIAQRAEAQYIEDPAASIDFSRVVHADQRFTSHRPIVAGDQLTTVLHVDSVTHRASIAMVSTRCEISVTLPDGSTAPVSTVKSTLAVRGDAS